MPTIIMGDRERIQNEMTAIEAISPDECDQPKQRAKVQGAIADGFKQRL
jgi:hypothetical protein